MASICIFVNNKNLGSSPRFFNFMDCFGTCVPRNDVTAALLPTVYYFL